MRLDVRSWLEAEGFGQYAGLFESRLIDGEALSLLTDDHLKELGLPIGPRVKLLAAIARLRSESGPVERRHLTIMFVDLVGSTRLSTRLDPEDLRDTLRAYQEVIAAQVSSYEGHVAQYVGDGALIYFGYPRAHEDDPERAIRAALAMVRDVATLRTPAGEPLAVHIGIASGRVVAGDLFAKERAVIGETPNLAARLVDLGAAGEIVVSAQTRALTGNLFEMRDLGPQRLKGLPLPVTAYTVLSERPLETRFEARQGATLAPMVGREAELAFLTERWRLAAKGRGQVVVLTGEAGIGKSRIVHALDESLRPLVRIKNQCSPYHAESALHPMIQQLVRDAGIQAGEGLDAQLDRLEALLEGAERTEVALLAALLGLDGASRYGPIGLTPEQQRARTFETLLAQVVRVSKRGPVFWVLEDAHWIDPTTLDLLALCVARVSRVPVLAVITARPEFAHDFGNADYVSHLSLGRLARGHVATLVSQVTGGKTLPEPVLSEIATKTDGVPLFVEELTKSLLEAGGLRETGSEYVLDGELRKLSVPASLHDSMMARLDRHLALKEVAQSAACIGREFDRDLLATISGMAPAVLRDGLARLEEAGLVYHRGAAEGGQYIFKHALVRDAAYESLLKSRRQEVHARILAALEVLPGSALEVLAQHAAEAGLAEKAIDLWQKAGVIAMSRPAYQEAISHFNQALRLVGQMPRDAAGQERRLRLLLLIGQATIPLRGYSHSETVAAFARAQEMVSAMGDDAPHRFSVSYAMWVAYYVRGEHLKALDIARDMQARAERDRSDARMLSALRALGIAQMITGELAEADATFSKAQQLAHLLPQSREQRIAVAQRFAADPDIATQFHVGLTLWALGRVDRACALIKETVAAARAMGHAHTLGHALTHGAIFAVAMRDAPTARRLSAEAISFADEHDMELWRGYGAILLGYALVLEGDFAGALPTMERGFARLERTQTGTMVAVHHAAHAYALAAVGRFEEAASEAAIVRAEVESGTERYYWPESLRWMGDYLKLVPGTPIRDVEKAYEASLFFARQQQGRSWELGSATSLAQLWAARGERERAADLLAPLLSAFTDGAGTPVVSQAAALLATLQQPARALLRSESRSARKTHKTK